MKRILCLVLSLTLTFSAVPAFADGEPVTYLYSFRAGSLLEGGKNTEIVNDLMRALQLSYTSQSAGGTQAARLRVLSEGEEAFSLTAQESADGEYAVTCSLLGDNVLVCRREQLGAFLRALVKMLENLKVLKGENLEKVNSLADKLADRLDGWLHTESTNAGDAGVDLTPYLEIMKEKAFATVEQEPDETEREETGAVKVTVFTLNEETRRELVEAGLQKALAFPVIGSRLKEGGLQISGNPVTVQQIRAVFSDPPGETTLKLYTDAEGQPVRIILNTPDMTDLTADSMLAEVRGIELTIRREDGENGHRISTTILRLPGLEGDLATLKLDKGPGEAIPPVEGKKIHNVGEMNSDELLKVINSMKLTILSKAIDMLLILPKSVFDLLGSKLFG